MDNLEMHEKFRVALYNQCVKMREESKKIGVKYNPTRLIDMVMRLGAFDTVCDLMRTEKNQEGFFTLAMNDMLDCTVEALVIQPEWIGFLPEDVIDAARQRLDAVGYFKK